MLRSELQERAKLALDRRLVWFCSHKLEISPEEDQMCSKLLNYVPEQSPTRCKRIQQNPASKTIKYYQAFKEAGNQNRIKKQTNQ